MTAQLTSQPAPPEKPSEAPPEKSPKPPLESSNGQANASPNADLESSSVTSSSVTSNPVTSSPVAVAPAAYTGEKLNWDWRGYDIKYVAYGEGPPVVLIHGFGASIGHWRKIFPRSRKQATESTR